MTDNRRNHVEPGPTPEVRTGQAYEAPTLVRYGTLFVTVNACSVPGSTGDIDPKTGQPSTDLCDADDGLVDGPKKTK